MKKYTPLLASLLLGGCAVGTAPDTTLVQPSSWQLQGATGSDFTLDIADNMFTGRAGCNRYFTDITKLADGALTLGPIGATRMMCLGGDLMQQESAFLQTLETVVSYRIDGQQLILSDSTQADILTFNPVNLTTK